jgi:nucleoside-diphosphate-sugar epimerase
MICFLTGSTGFLGKNISTHFVNEGLETISTSRDQIANKLAGCRSIDLLIHAAGRAHSTKNSKEEVKAFFNVNFDLTKRITETISQNRIELNTFVFISTVAVYGLEEGLDIKEGSPLNGNSPYAKSKKIAEEHLQKWAKERGVNLVILRLPLIFGENAPGNLGAMERAIKGRYYLQIGEGKARRSMVHVKQLAEFLPTLIGKSGIYNLTDGYHPTYAEVANRFGKLHSRRIKSLSLDIIRPIARIGDVFTKFPLNSYRLSKLNQTLIFNDEKARKELGWKGSNALEV